MNAASAGERAICFLRQAQETDGSFHSLSSPDPHDFTGAKRYRTTFSTSLILTALHGYIDHQDIKNIIDSGKDFLLTQPSPSWSFNYWQRDSSESREMPYPDDLDDTFCALSALQLAAPERLSGAPLARIISILTTVEVKPGGPYRTWIVPPNADRVWLDCDLAVNSNVAYFLSLQDIELERLAALVEKAVSDQDFFSPYYPSDYPVVYFISRFYRGAERGALTDWLLARQQKDGSWENPLHTALAVSSLRSLGHDSPALSAGHAYLAATQGEDGSWPAAAFCLDPAKKGARHFSGSPALTTAFCLEALQEALISRPPRTAPPERISPPEEDRLRRAIVAGAHERIDGFSGELKAVAAQTLEKTLRSDSDAQILLLPLFCRRALGTAGAAVPEDLLIQAGQASLWGWIAYSIYDDFLDEEGRPVLLPVANLALREMLSCFDRALPRNEAFAGLVRRLLDEIEAANCWEAATCRIPVAANGPDLREVRIPDYGRLEALAGRSIGHALAPLSPLFWLGYAADSPEVQRLLEFFRHYLIARQLNDDAHDWEEDLARGQINAVGARILRKLPAAKKTEPYRALLPHLQAVFWETVFPATCARILKELASAERCLHAHPALANRQPFQGLLEPLQSTVKKAISKQREMSEFLDAYARKET